MNLKEYVENTFNIQYPEYKNKLKVLKQEPVDDDIMVTVVYEQISSKVQLPKIEEFKGTEREVLIVARLAIVFENITEVYGKSLAENEILLLKQQIEDRIEEISKKTKVEPISLTRDISKQINELEKEFETEN
ncbi:hypothetical protein N5B56_01800 [Eubacterium sp. LFL-14]|uniref:Uncharacterized protein n=1 Tax=Eubacterium album TaxID=2978477 RepID=A0ABT2LX00_9FIRM|nr:hypothetical protein [Eubacterium sp. LFL-14]MCT7397821.1 hypothetical protein [Eubacterium sp. LFL-14]